jgi:DNA-directed RNA polymerase specialized sigma24 family protein
MVDVVVNEFLSRPINRRYKPYRSEFHSEATLQLVKCSKSFDPYYGVLFKTYASHCMRDKMYNLVLKLKKRFETEQSFDTLVGTSFEPFCIDQNLEDLFEEKKELKTYRPISEEDLYVAKTDFDRQIIKECFLGGKSPKDFSKETGESYWKIHHRIRLLRKKLRESGVDPEDMYSFLKWTEVFDYK